MLGENVKTRICFLDDHGEFGMVEIT